MTVVRYTWLDGDVKKFKDNDDRKLKTEKSWRALEGVICSEIDQYCPVTSSTPAVTPAP